jgi:hypothetical protein
MQGPRTLLLVAVLLVGCGEPNYPDAWPRPASSFSPRKGACPDLTGAYDEVRSELSWLLGPDPDFEKSQPFWFEHRAIVTQAEDGSWLKFSLSLNENGLPAFREHLLKYNNQGSGEKRGKDLLLKEGRDYSCSGGWLYSRHFPQSTRVHAWMRKSLQVARDREGSLIAGATISKSQSIGWGDSPRIALGNWDDTRWYRWPRRDPRRDSLLHDAQSVDLHRFPWINNGSRIPVRISNFFLEPVCVRLVEDGRAYPIRGSELVRTRGDDSPPPIPCPEGWGKLGSGGLILRELDIPNEIHGRYRIDWFPLSEAPTKARSIDIPDVRRLPTMPERK